MYHPLQYYMYPHLGALGSIRVVMMVRVRLRLRIRDHYMYPHLGAFSPRLELI